MAKFSDMDVERHVLSLFFQSPFHIKTGNLNMEIFSKVEHKALAKLIRQFVLKYKSVPTAETLRVFANELIRDSQSIDNLSEALLLLDDLPVTAAAEAEFYFKRAENYRIGRELFTMHDTFGKRLDNEIDVDFLAMRKDIFKKTLHMGEDEDRISRGFIYDNIPNRVKIYKSLKSGDNRDLIPFGIESLDNTVGSMRRKGLALIYSMTGGGKTVFAINLAYNAAVQGFNVMYFTAEISKEAVEAKIDSLASELDSKHILYGKLSESDEKKYIALLKKQKEERPSIWVTHVPIDCSMTTIIQEIETYTTSNGFGPDLVIIDYANLVEPIKRYQDRSAKFDNLLKEMHDYAGYYNFACVTMMQESRIAALNDIKKKKHEEEDTDGVHNIGLSHHAADHCEIVLRLKWKEADIHLNRIKVSVDKNRFGPTKLILELFANFAITYIGDRKSTLTYKLL